ncbi:MAG TPA: ABC transporter substrate-binding protein [Candidatus Limnocylindrales bacterium]
MSRSTRWSRLAPLGVVAILFAACSGSSSPAPSASSAAAPSTAASEAPAASASEAAYAGTSYPDTAVDCASKPAGYTGEFSQIKAVDRLTVEFDLCAPDVAFLAKLAFATNGIQDSDWLDAHAPDKSYVKTMNGTGPYKFKEWVAGDHITMEANPDYWGTKAIAPTLIFKWSDTAAQRLQELQSGAADGIDNVGTDDYATVQGDSSLQLVNRDAFTILYLGFNVDDAPWNNEKVRQAIAMGIDRKRINDTFDPPGSEVADYFTPCSVPGGCEGDKWYNFNVEQAKQMLKDANFDFSKTYDIYFRPKARGYLPNPPGVIQDLQAQFKTLGIDVKIHQEDNAAYLPNSSKGQYPLFLLGWGGDYPDMTDFVDYHFGIGANSAFGKKFDDITTILSKAASETDATARLGEYKDANNLIKQHVPMVPLTHAASAMAFKADVKGAVASPLGVDIFSVMDPGGRDQFVFQQNAETSGLYCGDESDGDSLRNCEQVYEGLYGYELGKTGSVPALATKCEPNTDGTKWTCTLRDGVKFHDGAAFDANDVVASFAAQWDTKNKNHVGNAGTFDYFPALWGGYLNPPAS